MEKKHMIMGMLIIAGIIIIAGAASADYTGLNVTQSDQDTKEMGWVQYLGIGAGILFIIVGIVVNFIYKPAPEEDEDEDEDDEAEEYECPTCGAGVPATASECEECGELFDAGGDDVPDDEEEPDDDDGPEDEAEPDMSDADDDEGVDDGDDDDDDDEVYECPTCGGGVGDNDTVCPHCGEEFE